MPKRRQIAVLLLISNRLCVLCRSDAGRLGMRHQPHRKAVGFEVLERLTDSCLVLGPVASQEREAEDPATPSKPRNVLDGVFGKDLDTAETTLAGGKREQNPIVVDVQVVGHQKRGLTLGKNLATELDARAAPPLQHEDHVAPDRFLHDLAKNPRSERAPAEEHAQRVHNRERDNSLDERLEDDERPEKQPHRKVQRGQQRCHLWAFQIGRDTRFAAPGGK
eukprot:Amastigsp_a339840_147.p2 type:complete len:221 gc:universal Amastigsp_a339840_147:380-1042(+)